MKHRRAIPIAIAIAIAIAIVVVLALASCGAGPTPERSSDGTVDVGYTTETLVRFFDDLGPERAAALTHVSATVRSSSPPS